MLNSALNLMLTIARRYPFDTVKVRLQTLGASVSAASASGPSFSGPIDCILKTWKNDGFMGFYRGLSSPVVGAAFEAAVLFSSFGQMTYFMTGSKLPENMTFNYCITSTNMLKHMKNTKELFTKLKQK